MSQSQTNTLQLIADIRLSEKDGDKKRTFQGVANTGNTFNYFGEKCVIDLSQISHKQSIPIFNNHNPNERIGYGQLAVENNQLIVMGQMLDNELAKQIINDADNGFPFQLSVGFRANSMETVKDGTVSVNNRQFNAPITILKENSIQEVSFVSLGADKDTSVIVLSKQEQPPMSEPKPKKTDDVEALKAEIEKLKTENKQLKADKKLSDINGKLSLSGFKQDDNGEWQGINKATFELLLSANEETANALIEDLAKTNVKPNLPINLSEEVDKTGDKQTNENPLVAQAIKLNDNKSDFV